MSYLAHGDTKRLQRKVLICWVLGIALVVLALTPIPASWERFWFLVGGLLSCNFGSISLFTEGWHIERKEKTRITILFLVPILLLVIIDMAQIINPILITIAESLAFFYFLGIAIAGFTAYEGHERAVSWLKSYASYKSALKNLGYPKDNHLEPEPFYIKGIYEENVNVALWKKVGWFFVELLMVLLLIFIFVENLYERLILLPSRAPFQGLTNVQIFSGLIILIYFLVLWFIVSDLLIIEILGIRLNEKIYGLRTYIWKPPFFTLVAFLILLSFPISDMMVLIFACAVCSFYAYGTAFMCTIAEKYERNKFQEITRVQHFIARVPIDKVAELINKWAISYNLELISRDNEGSRSFDVRWFEPKWKLIVLTVLLAFLSVFVIVSMIYFNFIISVSWGIIWLIVLVRYKRGYTATFEIFKHNSETVIKLTKEPRFHSKNELEMFRALTENLQLMEVKKCINCGSFNSLNSGICSICDNKLSDYFTDYPWLKIEI